MKNAKKVTLDKVVLCQMKENDEITLTSSKIERNVKQNGKLKSDKVLKQTNGQTDSSSAKWNFEDEYKSYVQKSRSSDVSQPQKLPKIHPGPLALLNGSVVHDKSTDNLKTKTTVFDLERDYFEKMNGHVVLEKLSTSTINSHIRRKDYESFMIKNTRARKSINTRSNTMDNTNNIKSMKLQLASKPRVTLDQTIVDKYLTEKKRIDEIL